MPYVTKFDHQVSVAQLCPTFVSLLTKSTPLSMGLIIKAIGNYNFVYVTNCSYNLSETEYEI